MINRLLFSFFVLISSTFFSQINLSTYAEVSIVTAGPGNELYEAFGHSAIRIKDPVLNLDLIYNFGIFDFNQPNFYSNFAKGNMIYSLARYDFKYFLLSYKRDKRWLKEQVLNLNKKEKQAYFIYLENNALPENRNYRYDPYFDNCATILRDITKSILGKKIIFNNDFSKNRQTFRDLTNNKIHWNTWGSLGLNLIAGIKLDEEAKSNEYLFLPNYLYKSFKSARLFVENQPKDLVKKETIILNFDETQPKSTFFNPLLIFSIILFLGIFITFKDYRDNKKAKYFDFLLFFTTGIIGCILFFLWSFSSHSTAPNNFNVFWAFPLNLIVAFFFTGKRKSKFLINYLRLLLVLLLIIPIIWLLNIQIFPFVIIPILILLFIRILILYRRVIAL